MVLPHWKKESRDKMEFIIVYQTQFKQKQVISYVRADAANGFEASTLAAFGAFFLAGGFAMATTN